MNGWSALDDFLRTDPRDVGCAEAMELLHVYIPTWWPRTPRRRNATRVSQLTCARADRAARTSPGCSRRCAAQRNDQPGGLTGPPCHRAAGPGNGRSPWMTIQR